MQPRGMRGACGTFGDMTRGVCADKGLLHQQRRMG